MGCRQEGFRLQCFSIMIHVGFGFDILVCEQDVDLVMQG